MQRRSWLKLGLASAAILAAGGGVLSLVESGLAAGGLSASGRKVFTAVGNAVLDGSLPASGAERSNAMNGLIERIDALVAGLPPHAQDELSQLLSILSSAAGRRTLAGLAPTWEEASVAQVQEALQGMRLSRLSLRQQAYQALHDITASAYFSESATWAQMGYPGPMAI